MNQDYVNYNSSDDDEVEIDLGKMFAALFRKTRQILASTIVLALVVGVCAYVTQYAKIKNQYSDENLAALEKNLTASEIQNINTLYSRYKAYQSEINDSQTYMNKSMLMTMDSNNVTRENIGFLVNSNQSGIADFFSTYALGQDEYDKIAAVYGEDADADYISELVSISTPDQDTESKIGSSKISIETANGDTIFDGGTITKGYSQLMNVSVIGPSKDSCEQVSSLVQDAILAYAEKLKESGVTLTITKISEVYREGVYQELADQQQAKIAANSDLVSAYNTFVTDNVSSLSDDQKNLFTFLQNRDDQKATGISSAKYFVIGAAAGFLYTRTDDCMLPKGRFVCVLLAPTILVTAGIVAAGFVLSYPAESLIVAAVHLSGCVGDWDMAGTIATTSHVTHVKDSETGCILLG